MSNDQELATRVKLAVSLLLQAQDAVSDVFYATDAGSGLEYVSSFWECKQLRHKLIEAALADGLTNEQIGVGEVSTPSPLAPVGGGERAGDRRCERE